MINFNSVSKAFGEDAFALRNVTFSVESGELVVITGPSGSGKTTLMRLLTKEYEPTEGEIFFDGEPLHDIKRSQVHKHRRKIGVVFQDYKLLPELNVWENIALSLNIMGQKQAEIEERVSDLLRLISLDEKAFLFPSQLSGGEAQRVSIARALATAPTVIFADEPTGNLDAETSASIARLLQKINKLGTTVLIATHDISVLDMLENERHMHLEHGELTSDNASKGSKKAAKSVAAPAKEDKKGKVDEVAKLEEPPVEADSKTPPEAESEPKPKKAGFKLQVKWPFGKKKAKNEVEEEKPVETAPPAEKDTKKSDPKDTKTEINDDKASVTVEKL